MNKEYRRFLNLRRRVMEALERELRMDNYCKENEGKFELFACWPDYIACKYARGIQPSEPEYYVIHLDSYVLGPGRHYEWRGKTLETTLNRAERDINEWIKEADDG